MHRCDWPSAAFMRQDFRQTYVTALEALVGRKLTRSDGFSPSEIAACEKRLRVRLPSALRAYYRLAGKHPINLEHNRLYTPKQFKIRNGKLVFMEENQCVVFWGLDTACRSDPEVFQATREAPLIWYSEECTFSEFIIKMLRWQRGQDEQNN